jgi:diadenosine tetraphosphate (Ap4A) HIT family hydrolase
MVEHLRDEADDLGGEVGAFDVPGCLACDLARGRRVLPGGRIHESEYWYVEHCVGPLGLGTLIVKPKRHVTRVSGLSAGEASELGPVLHRSAAVVDALVSPEQVYVCLWSHAGGEPCHIHYVVQPVTSSLMAQHEAHGPRLQVAMFERGEPPPAAQIEEFAERARRAFSRLDA